MLLNYKTVHLYTQIFQPQVKALNNEKATNNN